MSVRLRMMWRQFIEIQIDRKSTVAGGDELNVAADNDCPIFV